MDITPETIAAPTRPIGFMVVHIFDAEGILIPGCDIGFNGDKAPPTLSSSQDGRLCYVGVPGVYDATIAYPGFKTVHRRFELTQTDKDGKPVGNWEQRVLLERDTN